jgi:hypothetical protein
MNNEMVVLTAFETNLVAAADSCDIARKEKNHTIQALRLAKGLSELKRALLVPEVLNIIKELMDTPTGFLTDKDPNKKVKNKTSGNWESPIPYNDKIVVECVADAMSKGLTIHNNEFNIIAGRMYPAQSGFVRKLADFKREHKIKANYLPSVPVNKSGKYYCEVVVWWQKEGEARQEEKLAWNLQAFSEDAALGKVKKRANEWLFNELTGNTWSSNEDFSDFSTVNDNDIEAPLPETQTPVIPISAILNAISKAETVEILNEKWQKAQTTVHGDSQEVKEAYDKRKGELLSK